MALAPVFPLSEERLEVEEVYKSFLVSNARNSKRTAGEYKSRVEEFFQMTAKKDLEFLTLEDIQKIKLSHVKLYVNELTQRGNTDKTISTKLYTVKSFYNELLKNELQVNPMIFDINLNIKSKQTESLSFEELDMLYEFMLNEKALSLEKYLFVKTLFVTGNRASATLNMTWDDITQKNDLVTGQKVWVVTVADKGGRDGKEKDKPIPDEFYEELQQLRTESNKLFNFTYTTIIRAFDRFSKKIGRDITPHSMKATGVTLGYQLTKDIELCRQYASHEDISTTALYLNEEKSYVNQLSYNMCRKLDESKLLNMSREELLNFLMDNKNADLKRSILMRLG